MAMRVFKIAGIIAVILWAGWITVRTEMAHAYAETACHIAYHTTLVADEYPWAGSCWEVMGNVLYHHIPRPSGADENSN